MPTDKVAILIVLAHGYSWRAECLRTNGHLDLIHVFEAKVVFILNRLGSFEGATQAFILLSRGVLARFRGARLMM